MEDTQSGLFLHRSICGEDLRNKYGAKNPNVWIFSEIQTYIKSKPFADDAGNTINKI